MTTNFGYCCINLSLKPKKISVNNSCIKKTFQEKGLPYVSQLALTNVRNLIEIIKWNHQNGILVYRMSSDMFPWMSEYEIKDLPDYDKICTLGKAIGTLVQKYGQRLSFHPGPFNVLGSPNQVLVDKTIKELNQHAEIMDIFGLEQSQQFPINIHCNGVYEGKEETMDRWCKNYELLSRSAKRRLVVENDDKASMYSVQDLFDGIHKRIGIPITFDYHHHRFNDGGLTEKSAFILAYETWYRNGVKPLFHYSSCRKTFEDPECKAQAHADYIYERINDYGMAVDIEIEAKAKDFALFKYLNTQKLLLEEYLPM